MEPTEFDFSRYYPENHSYGTTLRSYAKVDAALVEAMMGFKKPVPVKENPQVTIDNAVREALAKPAIEAEEARQQSEIERRLDLADEIGYNDDHEIGTVLKWTRRLGKDTEFSQSKEYAYAAMKAGDGNWYLTGQQQNRAGGWKWSALLEWMITGDHTVENLKIATTWVDVI